MHVLSSASFSWVSPLLLFSLVSSITPGPNNAMLTASGLHHGFSRTLPHMLGVSLGFALMVVLVGLGLGALFAHWPWLYTLLQALSIVYLTYLAWRIIRAARPNAGASGRRPMRWWQAVAFQWTNPKMWAMAVGIVAAYIPSEHFFFYLWPVALLCALVNLPCIALWTCFGTLLRHWLHRDAVWRMFNLGMASLLLASIYPLVDELLQHGLMSAQA